MLEKIPRALALRTMIVVSLILCSPALLVAANLTAASGVPPIGDNED